MNSTLNPIHSNYGFPVPLTLKCTVSGKENTFTDPEYIKKRIEKAGSLEVLLKTYVCKASKSKQEKPRPRGKIWKGESVAGSTPVRQIHYVLRYKDGSECNVYAPDPST